MGLFSDPAAQPDIYLLDASEELQADATMKPPKRGSGGRTKRTPRRMKSLETTLPEGAPALPIRSGGRRRKSVGRRMSLRDGSSIGGGSSRRSSSMSMDSSSMAEHLEEIEAFCLTLQSAQEDERNEILRNSLLQQVSVPQRNGRRKSQRRSSMA